MWKITETAKDRGQKEVKKMGEMMTIIAGVVITLALGLIGMNTVINISDKHEKRKKKNGAERNDKRDNPGNGK